MYTSVSLEWEGLDWTLSRGLTKFSLFICGLKFCVLLQQKGRKTWLNNMKKGQGDKWELERYDDRVKMGMLLAALPHHLPSRDLAQLSTLPSIAVRSSGEDWSSRTASYCYTLLAKLWLSLQLSCSKVHPYFLLYPLGTYNTVSLIIFHTLEDY